MAISASFRYEDFRQSFDMLAFRLQSALPRVRAARRSYLPFSFRLRFSSSLAVLEQRDGTLQHASLSAITAAQAVGGPIIGFIAGNSVMKLAEEAAKIKALSKIIVVENGGYEKVHRSASDMYFLIGSLTENMQGLPETYAPLLVENIRDQGCSHVFASHSAFGKSLMPRVAAMLDVQQISDISAVESEDTFVRPIYAGNAILTVQSTDKIKLVTVRGASFPAAEVADGSAEVVKGSDPEAKSETEWVSEDLATSERPDLASAGRVVSGGRGLKSKEEFDRLIPPLADALGAAIGASRAAVDSGYADNSLQVGQTGKNVAPQLYLCAGISGAIQHLAGMKDSKVIAAINKDGDAPIFQVADVGLVGDLFEKVPELTEKLKG